MDGKIVGFPPKFTPYDLDFFWPGKMNFKKAYERIRPPLDINTTRFKWIGLRSNYGERETDVDETNFHPFFGEMQVTAHIWKNQL